MPTFTKCVTIETDVEIHIGADDLEAFTDEQIEHEHWRRQGIPDEQDFLEQAKALLHTNRDADALALLRNQVRNYFGTAL